ncbi:hypothetical protein GGI05_000482 [Coemansia sp. RSA 2603]|nr:hypothetical protein GGI05_000482 [Coemansia sp. RSA 2603]
MSRIGRWGLNTDQLIEFTPRDRSLASKLVAHWTNNINLRRVMLRMLYRGKKVELEAVTQFRHMLLQYLHVVIRSEN